MSRDEFLKSVDGHFESLRAIMRERESPPDVVCSISVDRLSQIVRSRVEAALRDGLVADVLEELVEVTTEEFERPRLLALQMEAERSDYESWAAAYFITAAKEMRLFDRALLNGEWHSVVEEELIKALVRIDIRLGEEQKGLEARLLRQMERELRARCEEKFGISQGSQTQQGGE